MKTLTISPKVWRPAVATLISTVAGYAVTAISTGGSWQSFLVLAGGAALTAVQAAVGYLAEPGPVIDADQPAFNDELPGGVTDAQRVEETA